MRKYQAERRAKLKVQDELDRAERQMLKIAREHIVGRYFFRVEMLPYVPSTNLFETDGLRLPVIHDKPFKLGDSKSLRDATLKVVEQEEKLLLVGEHIGWKALGIQGLSTAEHRNILKSTGNWDKDIVNATELLCSHGQEPPYTIAFNSKWYNKAQSLTLSMDYHFSPHLCDQQGDKNNALVVKVAPKNCTLLIGQDLTISQTKGLARVWEAITPIIENPKAICEITNFRL